MQLAYYDFAVSPYSYDFVHFATAAKTCGAVAIVFVPGERGWSKLTHDQEQARFERILKPVADAFPREAIVCHTREEAEDLMREHGQAFYPDGYTVAKPKAGHMLGSVVKLDRHRWLLPTQKATRIVSEWIGSRNPVVLTLRDNPIKPERNSNIAAWRDFARYLVWCGHDVVVVPDTESEAFRALMDDEHLGLTLQKRMLDQEWGGARFWTLPALDVEVRHALYMAAHVSIGVANGPPMLAFFSDAPTLMVKPLTNGHWETSSDYWQQQGIPVGSQPRWFTHKQRIIWKQDTLDTLVSAFETWERATCAEDWGPAVVPHIPTVAAGSVEMKQDHMRAALSLGLPKVQVSDVAWPGEFSVVGYGPSLLYTWSDLAGAICTTSGAHDFLIERGIVPTFHVECDPRPHKAMMFTPHPDVTYLIASCCHPDVFAKLVGYRVMLWHCDEAWTMDFLATISPQDVAIGGGGNAGLRAIQVGGAIGYRKFRLYGFDCSLMNGLRHAGPHTGKVQHVMRVRCGSQEFDTTPQMINSARQFMEMDKTGITIDIIGHGLLAAMVADANEAAQEKAA
jgi:hypothetical protein